MRSWSYRNKGNKRRVHTYSESWKRLISCVATSSYELNHGENRVFNGDIMLKTNYSAILRTLLLTLVRKVWKVILNANPMSRSACHFLMGYKKFQGTYYTWSPWRSCVWLGRMVFDCKKSNYNITVTNLKFVEWKL